MCNNTDPQTNALDKLDNIKFTTFKIICIYYTKRLFNFYYINFNIMVIWFGAILFQYIFYLYLPIL